MSKIYNEYLRKKQENSNKLYIFKSGIFYIFLSDDAKLISSLTNLKLTYLTENIYKCGFPSSAKDKYDLLFNKLNLNIEYVKQINNESSSKIINKLKKININNTTPLKAFKILNDLVEIANE